jgi:hypothetical protein
MECIIPTMLLDGYLCAHLHRLYLELALHLFQALRCSFEIDAKSDRVY